MFKPKYIINNLKNGVCFDEITLNKEGHFLGGLSLYVGHVGE